MLQRQMVHHGHKPPYFFLKMTINEAEQRFKSLGTETKRISFPLLFWEEFEQDCLTNYNNTYHLKIKADHDYRKSMQTITELIAQEQVNINNKMMDMEIQLETLREEILNKDIQRVGEDEKSSNTKPEGARNERKTFG